MWQGTYVWAFHIQNLIIQNGKSQSNMDDLGDFGGIPILGNLHIYIYTYIYIYIYVYLQRERECVCVFPCTGGIMWINHDKSPRTTPAARQPLPFFCHSAKQKGLRPPAQELKRRSFEIMIISTSKKQWLNHRKQFDNKKCGLNTQHILFLYVLSPIALLNSTLLQKTKKPKSWKDRTNSTDYVTIYTNETIINHANIY